MKLTFEKELTTNKGNVFHPNEVVRICPYTRDDGTTNDRFAQVYKADGTTTVLKYETLARFTDLWLPSMDDLASWLSDCSCESINNNMVEPDGHDHDGFPSWLLALQMC